MKAFTEGLLFFIIVLLATALIVTCFIMVFGDFAGQETWDVTIISAPQLSDADLYIIVEKSDGTRVRLNNTRSFATGTKDPAVLQSTLVEGKKYRVEVTGYISFVSYYKNILSATPIE